MFSCFLFSLTKRLFNTHFEPSVWKRHAFTRLPCMNSVCSSLSHLPAHPSKANKAAKLFFSFCFFGGYKFKLPFEMYSTASANPTTDTTRLKQASDKLSSSSSLPPHRHRTPPVPFSHSVLYFTLFQQSLLQSLNYCPIIFARQNLTNGSSLLPFAVKTTTAESAVATDRIDNHTENAKWKGKRAQHLKKERPWNLPSRLTFCIFRCNMFEKSTKYAPFASPKKTKTMMGTWEARRR